MSYRLAGLFGSQAQVAAQHDGADVKRLDEASARTLFDFFDIFDTLKTFEYEIFFKKTVFNIHGSPRKTILQHPPPCTDARLCATTGRLEYAVAIPPGSRLAFGFALAQEVWQPGKGDGVQFEIYVANQDTEWQLFSEYIDPKNILADRRWHDREIDLAPWVGQDVTIAFVTDPGPEGDDRYDWAGWGEPRIVLPAYYSFLEQLDQAEFEADIGYIRRMWMGINDDYRHILFQHPPSKIVYRRIDIPGNSILHVGIGVDPQVWSADMGDEIEFEILIQDTPTHLTRVLDRHVDPKHNPDDRRWIDFELDMTRFAGQTVDVHFVTRPGADGDNDYDWGGWSTPMLVVHDPAAPEAGGPSLGSPVSELRAIQPR
jgi:hypothetical protein